MKNTPLSLGLPVEAIRTFFFSSTFKHLRGVIPTKRIAQAMEIVGLNTGYKLLHSSILRGMITLIGKKQSLTSRNMAELGNKRSTKLLTGLPEQLSHVAITKLYNRTSVPALYEVFEQCKKGILRGAKPGTRAWERVRILDCTTFTSGHKKKGKPTRRTDVPLTKLGLSIVPQTYIPSDWMISHSHSDKEAFETLIQWHLERYIYVFDRGDIEVDFYNRIIASNNDFVTQQYSGHKIQWEYNVPVNGTPKVGHFKILRKGKGILGADPKTQVRVQLVKVENTQSETTDDTPTQFWFVSSLLDCTPKKIVKLWMLRWEVETAFNWIKKTLGIQGTNWDCVHNFEVFIGFVLLALLFVLGWAVRRFGASWWKPQRFSLTDVLRKFSTVLSKFWEYRANNRPRGKTCTCCKQCGKVMKM